MRAGAASHGWDAGRASTSSSWCRPKTCSTRSSSRACSIRPTSSWARRPSASSRRSSGCKPHRVVLDSLSEIRLLAQSSLRYRRQILALKHYFARSERDRADARRPDHRSQRQDGAQRRARRHPAGGTGARIWRRAAAAAGRQISRPALSRRLSRFRDRDRRRARLPAAGVGRAPDRVSRATLVATRIARAQRAAGRRRRARIEHADPRSGGHRQVAAGADLRRRGGRRAANARRCSCSTRNWACCSSAPRASASTCRRWSMPASWSSSRSTPPS